uniref:Uncharacterized protein n=1 Tax=Triticum urartu TaxID=4572 RepID=A0A8R7R2A6_TRIUA
MPTPGRRTSPPPTTTRMSWRSRSVGWRSPRRSRPSPRTRRLTRRRSRRGRASRSRRSPRTTPPAATPSARPLPWGTARGRPRSVAAGCRAAHPDELQGAPRPPLLGAQLPARSRRRQGQAQGAPVPLLQPLLQAPPLARPRGVPEVLREDHCPAPHRRSARDLLKITEAWVDGVLVFSFCFDLVKLATYG